MSASGNSPAARHEQNSVEDGGAHEEVHEE